MKEVIPLRKAFIALAVCLFFSASLHLLAIQGAKPPYALRWPDTSEYLEVVALLRGFPTMRPEVPWRIKAPMYPLLIASMGTFTSDWVKAAQLAALVPSILVAPVLCLVAWMLHPRFWSGCLAGLIAAFSWPLIGLGIYALSDAPFVFFSALALLFGLLMLKRGGLSWSVAAGAAAGCAWSTRANGLIYLGAILIPYLVRVFARPGHQGSIPLPRGLVIASCLLFVSAFCVTGKGPALVLRPLAAHLQDSRTDYLKFAIAQEAMLRTRGQVETDKLVWSLNEDCTGLQEFNLPWSEVLGQYGRRFAAGVKYRFLQNLEQDLPQALSPFLLIFAPLTIGLAVVCRRSSPSGLMMLVLFALPYILILPLITLAVRHIIPITVATTPLIGIGMAHLLVYRKDAIRARRWATTGVGGALLLSFMAYGIVQSYSYSIGRKYTFEECEGSLTETAQFKRNFEREQIEDLLYRRACDWITRDAQGRDVGVIASNCCVYAYTKHRFTTLPFDSPERIVRYCRNSNTEYLVLHDQDAVYRNHRLFMMFDKSDATTEIDGVRLTVVVRLKEDGQTIRVVKIE